MRIALMEQLPLLETLLRRRFAAAPFSGKVELMNARRARGEIQLAISDETRFPGSYFCPASLYLVESGTKILRNLKNCPILTCGMKPTDSLTLSSIGEEESMLCLQRETVFTGKSLSPFEVRIPFDRNYGIYQNIAAGFAFVLAERLFGEKTWNSM